MTDNTSNLASGWGEIKSLPTNTAQHPGGARSGDQLSIPFDDLLLNLQGPQASLVGQKSLSLEVPFDLPRRRGLHGFMGHLRYTVDRTPGSRATLFFGVGNATKVIQIPFEQKSRDGGNEPDTGTLPISTSQLLAETQFSIEQWPSEAESLDQNSRCPLLISIHLIGQRQTPTDCLLIQVVSLDLHAISYDGGSPN